MSIKVFNTDFYPRSPCGERPRVLASSQAKLQFLSTLSLRRATLNARFWCSLQTLNFYPRSPCGERPASGFFIGSRSQFLSTLSLRRATAKSHEYAKKYRLFLSTLSLRRATAFVIIANALVLHFYPRSPCGERLKNPEAVSKYMTFLSTLSLRRATIHDFAALHNVLISIHALLAESDIIDSNCNLTQKISSHALLAESDILGRGGAV